MKPICKIISQCNQCPLLFGRGKLPEYQLETAPGSAVAPFCTLSRAVRAGCSSWDITHHSHPLPPTQLQPHRALQAHDLPCPSSSLHLLWPPIPPYLDAVIPTTSRTPLQLPNNTSLPHLVCHWEFKPGGNPLLGQVMAGGSAELSKQHTQEDGKVLMCPKFFLSHPLNSTG